MVRAVDTRGIPHSGYIGSDSLLWTPAQSAQALAISPRKLWAMTNAGEIPCVRLGRALRYDPVDLREWIDRQKADCGG